MLTASNGCCARYAAQALAHKEQHVNPLVTSSATLLAAPENQDDHGQP